MENQILRKRVLWSILAVFLLAAFDLEMRGDGLRSVSLIWAADIAWTELVEVKPTLPYT